jgi:hypothetical protein
MVGILDFRIAVRRTGLDADRQRRFGGGNL